MSPREALQTRIVEWLAARSTHWTAPYGILPGLREIKRGKVRTITFGIARTLDAEAIIWSPTRIDLRTSRGDWHLDSEQALYALLEAEFHAPKPLAPSFCPWCRIDARGTFNLVSEGGSLVCPNCKEVFRA